MTDKKHYSKFLLLGMIILSGILYVSVPAINHWIRQVVNMFTTGDFGAVEEFVASYGSYAMAVSFFLMVFQAIAAPLPAFLITLANANLFGWWQGALLSWTSAMAGATVCFFIAKILGRDTVAKLTSRTGLEKIDVFLRNMGV